MNDFNDETPKARVMNAVYDTIKYTEMSTYLWSFAVERVALTNNSNTPLYEFDFEFDFPSDYLRLLDIEDLDYSIGNNINNGDGGFRLYSREGDKILTNKEGPINITYLKKNTTVSEYPVEFINALSWALAIAVTQRLVNNDQKMEVMLAMYKKEIKRAKKNNAIQIPNALVGDNTWMNR